MQKTMNKNLLLLASLLLVVGVGAGCETTTSTSTSVTDNSAMEEEYDDDDHMEDEHEGMTEQEEAMHMMEEEVASEDAAMMEVDEETLTAMTSSTIYDVAGDLEDVTGGNATGVAQAGTMDGDYVLYATMENLPELEEGYFYEGWAVRHTPFDFISTGAAEQQEDGTWVNAYKSATDYSDYTNYVLTVEPDDGDPAPAEHILEGMMK